MGLRSNGEDLDTPLGRRPFLPLGPVPGSRYSQPAGQSEPRWGQPKTESYSEAQASEATRLVQEEWLAQNIAQGFKIFGSQSRVAEQSPFKPDRIPGPVQFVLGLMECWNLDTSDATALLGFEDETSAEAVLSGRVSLRGVDTKARIGALFRIKSLLASLFRDEAVERDWMNSPVPQLGGRSPIALLREGSLENLLTLRQYVEHISGL